jgi:hypothetical protein
MSALTKAREKLEETKKAASARLRKAGEKLDQISGTPLARVGGAAAGGALAGALDAYDVLSVEVGEGREIKAGLFAGAAIAWMGPKNAAIQAAGAGMIGYAAGCFARDEIDRMLLEGDSAPTLDAK